MVLVYGEPGIRDQSEFLDLFDVGEFRVEAIDDFLVFGNYLLICDHFSKGGPSQFLMQAPAFQGFLGRDDQGRYKFSLIANHHDLFHQEVFPEAIFNGGRGHIFPARGLQQFLLPVRDLQEIKASGPDGEIRNLNNITITVR